MSRQQLTLFDRKLLAPALVDSVIKLDPRVQWRNPVMFVVYIGAIVASLLYFQALGGHGEASPNFVLGITVWLVFTVLFANFAEALAEGRSRAQAAELRAGRRHCRMRSVWRRRSQIANAEAEQKDYAAKCAERTGKGTALLANLGTRDVVKDMDVLRSV